jgi:cold-inducible RNA-binding protein
MSKKLFVGNLSWGTTNESLRQAFQAFGEVEDVHIVTDRETGRSRGFGFVTFADDEAADTAKSALNGTEVDGRPINIDEARERRPRGGGGGGFGGGSRW